jgi:hypothetical protein
VVLVVLDLQRPIYLGYALLASVTTSTSLEITNPSDALIQFFFAGTARTALHHVTALSCLSLAIIAQGSHVTRAEALWTCLGGCVNTLFFFFGQIA